MSLDGFMITLNFLSLAFYITFSSVIYSKFQNSFDSLIILLEDNLNYPIYSINTISKENNILYQIGYHSGSHSIKECDEETGCQKRGNISPYTPIYIWDGNKFYINNNKEIKYESLLRNSVDFNEECKFGFKKCGILDTNNRIMCTEKYNDCPINKIIINKESNPPNDHSYVTLNLNNGKYLHYTNEDISNNIIVNISLSLGYPCINPYELNTKIPQYKYDNNYKRYGCKQKFNGELYEKIYSNFIDSKIRKDVYNENNIDLKKAGNSYYKVLNEEYYLLSRNYYGVDFKCINNKNINMREYKYFNYWNKISKNFCLFSLIFSCIIPFLYLSFVWSIFTYLTLSIILPIIIFFIELISYLYLDKINFDYYCLDNIRGNQLYKRRDNLNLIRNLILCKVIYSAFLIASNDLYVLNKKKLDFDEEEKDLIKNEREINNENENDVMDL